MKYILLVLLLCLSFNAFADGGLPSQPYIYVEGHGEAQCPADFVTLNFTLGVLNLDPAVSSKQMAQAAAKVFALLDGEKIAAEDVVADDLRSEKQYASKSDPSATEPGEFQGFHVTRDFTVTVRDISMFPRLIDNLLALGVETFGYIKEGLNNQPELTDQVRNKALADARRQAEQTLNSEQMKIDSVFAVSPVVFTQITGRLFRDGNIGSTLYDVGRPDPSKYRLAPVSVMQTIHVIYLISPAK